MTSAPATESSDELRTATVALARADRPGHTPQGAFDTVRTAVDLLGGLRVHVRPGATVLIKPNQTAFLPADHGATTDPWVVAALARLAYAAGAARVRVGDMPGGGSGARDVMETTGVSRAARDVGAEPVYMDAEDQRTVPVPRGRLVRELALPRSLVEADVVINVPKAKTHFVDRISGALKNWMGVMRPDVRGRYHDADTMQYVFDCHRARPPDLHVMDALVAGEGNGPGATTPKWVGCVVASTDPVALDVTAARLLGFDPAELVYANAAAVEGLGIADPRHIRVLGASLEEARTPLVPTNLDLGFPYLLPVRVLVGEEVTMPGTVGHFKFVADLWHKDHAWDLIRRARGTPTILIGRVEDPEFERHLDEGPYITIDDSVPDRYKRHPRVHHIPGHPVTDEMLRGLIEALGVKLPATAWIDMTELWYRLRAGVRDRFAGASSNESVHDAATAPAERPK